MSTIGNSQYFDILLSGGTLVLPQQIVVADVGIRGGQIAEIGNLRNASASEVLDLRGLHVLPGVIDTQVHFREPGLEHKEDLESGTRAAVMGGVTGVFEMPNTNPPTVTVSSLNDKIHRATGRAWCNFAFYGGAEKSNVEHLADLERVPGSAGVKIFLGSSTGHLMLDDPDDLQRALKSLSRRSAIHAEDQTRLVQRQSRYLKPSVMDHPVIRDETVAFLATERVAHLAYKLGRPVHILHVTTQQEMELISKHRAWVSCEVTPQHLTLSAPECYERLGTLAQMNPPIRGLKHQQGLWEALRAGVIDVIGSDHAPHTLEEKAVPYPGSPSGMTGVQTLLPLMLHHHSLGRLSLRRLVELTSQRASELFGIKARGGVKSGEMADLTVVDLKAVKRIENRWIASRCGWTPYDGMRVTGWPMGTFVSGQRVMWDGELMGSPQGRPYEFNVT